MAETFRTQVSLAAESILFKKTFLYYFVTLHYRKSYYYIYFFKSEGILSNASKAMVPRRSDFTGYFNLKDFWQTYFCHPEVLTKDLKKETLPLSFTISTK